jgi:hypothetical protein
VGDSASRGRRLIASAIIAAIFVPQIALADGAGVIAVSTSDRAAVAAAMSQAMAGRSSRVLEDAVAEARGAVAAGAVPVEALSAFKRVRDEIDAGWRAYLRVAVEQSRDALVGARTDAEQLVALPGGAELYADAALRLGMVLARLNRRDEATAVIALAIAIDPDRPVTTAEFSPDLVDAVDAARGAPVALHAVHIDSLPAGAAIRIDGRDVGKAPLDVQVTRAQHLVIARAAQYHAAVQGIAADASAIEIQLEPDEQATRISDGASIGMPELAAQQLVDATLRYADLDELVVVADTVRRGGPTLLAQRCAGPAPARCSAVVELGYTDRTGLEAAARSAWEAVKVGDLRYEPAVLTEREGIRGGERHWYKSPLVWTGVGAAVVVGAVVAIVLVSGATPPPVVGVDGGAFGKP